MMKSSRKFSQAPREESRGNLPFITFQALGRAIILTGQCPSYLFRGLQESTPGYAELDKEPLPPTPHRSIVLIDEIDKAHRDFPNDLLNEIDRMFFTIPELGSERVSAEPSPRPIVLITSNSEKNLPDPFLRRCAYYHIEFPNAPGFDRILRSKLAPSNGQPGGGTSSGTPFISEVVKFFVESRGSTCERRLLRQS